MNTIHAGKCVIKAQKIQGITNTEFAELAKTSPQQVVRWRSNANMKLHTVQKICDVLGITIEYFITISYKL